MAKNNLTGVFNPFESKIHEHADEDESFGDVDVESNKSHGAESLEREWFIQKNLVNYF